MFSCIRVESTVILVGRLRSGIRNNFNHTLEGCEIKSSYISFCSVSHFIFGAFSHNKISRNKSSLSSIEFKKHFKVELDEPNVLIESKMIKIVLK